MSGINNVEDFIGAKQGQRRLQELIKTLQKRERILERVTDSEISRFIKDSRDLSSSNALMDYCVVEFKGNGYDGILKFSQVVNDNQGQYIGFSEDKKITLEGTIDGPLGVHKVNEYRQHMVVPLISKGSQNRIELPHELSEVIVNYLDKVVIDVPIDLIDGLALNVLNSFDDKERRQSEKRKKLFESLSGKAFKIIMLPYLSKDMDFFVAETKGGHTGPLIGGPGYMKTAYKLQIGKE